MKCHNKQLSLINKNQQITVGLSEIRLLVELLGILGVVNDVTPPALPSTQLAFVESTAHLL